MNNRAKVRRQVIALGNFRYHLPLQALHSNSGTITAAKCGQWYRFMQTLCLFRDTHSPEPKEDLVKLTNKALWVSGVSNTLLMMSILILVQYKDLKVFRPKYHPSGFSDRIWIYSGYPNF